jgi:TRAP-type C4-dicarboxylate transport system permease small subunit
VRYGLVWSVMLGSALVAHERGHVRIDVLGAVVAPSRRRFVDAIAGALTWAFTLLLVVAGVRFVERTLSQQSASLGVPMWAVYAAVPVGAAIEAWFMLFPRPEREGAPREGDVLL